LKDDDCIFGKICVIFNIFGIEFNIIEMNESDIYIILMKSFQSCLSFIDKTWVINMECFFVKKWINICNGLKFKIARSWQKKKSTFIDKKAMIKMCFVIAKQWWYKKIRM
tara:strand:- start:6487 stop:6816 length:330 start_codon:yes stop_codon:yes gene_type:complete